MRTSQVLFFAAPVLSLTMAWSVPQALAQESMAGLGAASAMGATLGASAVTNISPGQATRGINSGTNAAIDEAGDPSGRGGMGPGGIGGAGAAAAAPKQPPPLASPMGNGQAILSQLLAPRFQPIPELKNRTARQQAAYSRRVSRLSPTARKKLVLQKYKIAPVNYMASYLPADRFKFGKIWKFVSTETDRFYYRPADMARRKFNPNKVIGFRTWQDAMLSGYRPDPVSKPEPGFQLAYFASLTRDEPLIQTVEYAYAGQITPANMNATYNYVRQVKAVIDRNPSTRPYTKDTINSILTAYLVGDASLIPKQIGYVPPPVVATGANGVGGRDMMDGSRMGSSSMPSMGSPGMSSPNMNSSNVMRR